MMWAAMMAAGIAKETRGSNMLDGGIPNYRVYETADGKHLSVGPLEPQFYAELIRLTGVDESLAMDPEKMGEALADVFRTRTQGEWAAIFDGSDACVAPILPFSEAVEHPHIKGRGVFVEKDGHLQPAPAPRFSRTEASLSLPPRAIGEDTVEALTAWGIDNVDDLIASGAAAQA
jgi:alpha-methylacyl-CoA racemase